AGSPAAGPAGPALQAPAAAPYRPAAAPSSGPGIFSGAGKVAMGLVIFGWLTLVGGQLVGLGAAASYSCTESFLSSCNGEFGTRLMLYVTFAGPTLVSALFAWGIAYCIWF